jgi:hypothetical protein
VLLDTTFFIDLEGELHAGVPGPCAAFRQTHRHETKHVSVVTMGEFAVGASAAKTVRFFRGYRSCVCPALPVQWGSSSNDA